MKHRGRLILRICLVLAILAGIYGRAADLGGRPFWGDEAWVADTILHNSYEQLWRQTDVPLPPLFAVAAKACNSLADRPEVGLRLLSMACGIAILPIGYLLLRTQRVSRSTLLAAMCLLASSTMLVVWSRELKQYQVEAFTAILLALLTFRLRRSQRVSASRALAVGIIAICAAGPWLGYGFVFAGASLAGVLIMLRPVGGNRRLCVLVGIAAMMVMGVSTLVLLRFVAEAQGSHPGLVQFTSSWYIKPLAVNSWLRAGAYFCATSYSIVCPQILGEVDDTRLLIIIVATMLVWLLVAIGLWTWTRRSRAEMCLYTLGPWILLFLAALMGKYPFCATRMMVMWIVPVVIVMAAGLVRVVRAISIIVLERGTPGIVAALAIALLPVVFFCVCREQQALWVYHDFPRMLTNLRQQRLADEPVVATICASPAVRYYAAAQGVSVVCMPTDGGTCMIPGFSYRDLLARTVKAAGHRVWILTVTYEDRTRRDLYRILQDAGYKMKLAVDDTCASAWGNAQLYRADRQ